jgi:hypothetical protein
VLTGISVAFVCRSGKDKRLAMTWNNYLLCTLCVQEWNCAAMEVFWLLPLNSTQQNVTERATKVDILGIHTEHLMSIERLIGDKVSNEQGDEDLVGYALPK